ncbi:MAG: cyclic nucleotide-binding domain-containing protein [Spirochaetales bacterium]|nr:cyclic nucleotide-binding domain-containing protein [Spirochaetales bacterium]
MSDLLEKILFLEKVKIFQGLSLEELGEIAQIVETEQYQEEEVLFRMGDPGNFAYILVSGLVELSVLDKRGRKQSSKKLGAGTCFGELALLDGKARGTTAIVLEDSILAVIGRDDFINLVRKMPAIAVSIIEQMSVQLRESNKKLNSMRGLGRDFSVLSKRVSSLLKGE